MLPDVVALELTEAKKVLEDSASGDVQVKITRPPRGGEPVGEARIVRQRTVAGGMCELIIAYRDYSGVK